MSITRILYLATVCANAMVGGAVYAQSASSQAAAAAPPIAEDSQSPEEAASPSDNESGALGEIVVTAQKRAENVQRVPIAITTASPPELEKAGVLTVQSLGAA